MKSSKAFTLVEILIVVCVLGLLAGFLIPRFGNIFPNTNRSVAKSLANGLNGTMFAYRESVAGAQTNWTASATDEAKYELLYNAGLLPNLPSSLSGYVPQGYIFVFPSDLRGRVSITDPQGAAVVY